MCLRMIYIALAPAQVLCRDRVSELAPVLGAGAGSVNWLCALAKQSVGVGVSRLRSRQSVDAGAGAGRWHQCCELVARCRRRVSCLADGAGVLVAHYWCALVAGAGALSCLPTHWRRYWYHLLPTHGTGARAWCL